MVDKSIVIPAGATPLDFLQAVYMNSQLPLNTRLRAAVAAAPFCHAKHAVITRVDGNDLADRLERAVAASRKVKAEQRQKTIEHEPSPVDVVPEPPPDHAKPFASDLKSRFRRL